MRYEYSQTLLFAIDEFHTLGVVANIKDNDYNTEIEFIDPKKAQEFYSICESWNILIPYLRIKDGVLTYGATQSGTQAYQYYQYMSLILSFLNGEFKIKIMDLK